MFSQGDIIHSQGSNSMNFLIISKSLSSVQISCWASNPYIHLLVGYLCLDDPTNLSITFLKPASSCCHLIYLSYSLSQEVAPLSSWSLSSLLLSLGLRQKMVTGKYGWHCCCSWVGPSETDMKSIQIIISRSTPSSSLSSKAAVGRQKGEVGKLTLQSPAIPQSHSNKEAWMDKQKRRWEGLRGQQEQQ